MRGTSRPCHYSQKVLLIFSKREASSKAIMRLSQKHFLVFCSKSAAGEYTPYRIIKTIM